jgi:hypothetical protein
VLSRDPTNEILGLKISQSVDRKNDIDILIGIRVIVMVVRYHQLSRVDIFGNDTIAQITQLICNIEGLLIAQMHATGGNNRDSYFRQITFEGRKWHTFSRNSHRQIERPELVSYDPP